MIISGRVSLPYPSFLTAWLALDLGEVPTSLLPVRPAALAGTAEEITERAWEDLFERNLALGTRLDETLAGTLRRLAMASTRFYAYFHQGQGDTRSVLVAGASVVAAVDGDTVTLRPCWSDSGAKALVDMLPEVPRAQGEAVSAPAGELARVPAASVTIAVRPTGPAARMRWLLSQSRIGGGQLYVARRDPNGRYVVCDRPLSFIDTPAGRLLATERQAGDGTCWRSLIPADPPVLVRRLGALLPRKT